MIDARQQGQMSSEGSKAAQSLRPITDSETAAAGELAHVLTPYVDQEQLIRDQLHLIRMRVRAAAAHLEAAARDDSEQHGWPSALVAMEALVEARTQASLGLICLPITRIRDRFALTSSEERVLWTMIAHELCPIARHLIRGIATEQTSDPSTDTLRRIIYGQSCSSQVWHELGPEGALCRSGFIERSDSGADVPEHRQTWKIARRVLALTHGALGVDPAIAGIAELDHERTLRPCDLEVAGDAIQRVEAAFDRNGLVIVHGRVGHGRRSVLMSVAAARGHAVLLVHGRLIAQVSELAQRQIRAIARECRLLDAIPLVRDIDTLGSNSEAADRLEILQEEIPGLVLGTSSRPIARRWRRAPALIEIAPLGGSQRAMLWGRALPQASVGDTELLVDDISPRTRVDRGRR